MKSHFDRYRINAKGLRNFRRGHLFEFAQDEDRPVFLRQAFDRRLQPAPEFLVYGAALRVRPGRGDGVYGECRGVCRRFRFSEPYPPVSAREVLFEALDSGVHQRHFAIIGR